MSKKLTKRVIESDFIDFKESLRLYCRRKLKNEETRKKVAKIIGYEFSSLSACLDQRNKGSFEFWFKLVYYCASLENDAVKESFSSFFSLDQPFQVFKNLTESEIIFKNLSEIPLVNEDTKHRLAMSLKDMLLDLNNNIVKRLKRAGKL